MSLRILGERLAWILGIGSVPSTAELGFSLGAFSVPRYRR